MEPCRSGTGTGTARGEVERREGDIGNEGRRTCLVESVEGREIGREALRAEVCEVRGWGTVFEWKSVMVLFT